MCGGGKGSQSVCLVTGKLGVSKAKVAAAEMSDFFKMESLGTVIEPKCGSCRCGKCPVPGSRYSHREESELKMIEEGLRYDAGRSCWVTKYPYLHSKELLRGSREVALKSMLSTERSLRKDST